MASAAYYVSMPHIHGICSGCWVLGVCVHVHVRVCAHIYARARVWPLHNPYLLQGSHPMGCTDRSCPLCPAGRSRCSPST